MECRAAVVVVVSRNGRILVIKRKERPNDPWSGHIAFPGGRREGSETCDETALRECIEEVGIKPRLVKDIGIYFPNNAPDMKVRAYLGCVDEEFIPQIQKDEVDMAIWINPEQLEIRSDEFYFNGFRIWGMTFRILKDVLEKRFYEECLKK